MKFIIVENYNSWVDELHNRLKEYDIESTQGSIRFNPVLFVEDATAFAKYMTKDMEYLNSIDIKITERKGEFIIHKPDMDYFD